MTDWQIRIKLLVSLNKYSNYIVGTSKKCIYKFEKLPELDNAFCGYNIEQIVGDGTTFQKARNIMQWVADNCNYDGNSPLPPSLPTKILDYAFRENKPINCANRAILFSDALVSIGICALPVWLIHNYTLKKDGDITGHCHVIAQVWLPELLCWAAFDPSFNTFFMYNDKPISVPQMAVNSRKKCKFMSIANETGKTTEKGLLCTKVGLMSLEVFPGNNFKWRYDWNEILSVAPVSYIEHLTKIGYYNKNIKTAQIALNDLTGAPVFSVDNSI
jgi:hypothetical protein